MTEPQISNVLLRACNLPNEKLQMIMAGLGGGLTFKKTKDALLRTFVHGLGQGEVANKDQTGDVAVMYNSGSSRRGNWRSRWRGSSSSQQHHGSGRASAHHPFRRTNRTGRNGQIMTCNICRSIFHFASQCPDSDERRSVPTRDPMGWNSNGRQDSCKRACYVCNSTLHLAKDCPSRGVLGGSGPSGCYLGNNGESSGGHKVNFTL